MSKVLISNLTFVFEHFVDCNFFDQDKLFCILVLSISLNTKSMRSKFFT